MSGAAFREAVRRTLMAAATTPGTKTYEAAQALRRKGCAEAVLQAGLRDAVERQVAEICDGASVGKSRP